VDLKHLRKESSTIAAAASFRAGLISRMEARRGVLSSWRPDNSDCMTRSSTAFWTFLFFWSSD